MIRWRAPAVGEPSWQAWVGVAGCLSASASSSLSAGLIGSATPDLAGALGVGADDASWLAAAYAAGEAAAILTLSALANIVSFRRLFLTLLLSFMAVSTIAALSPHFLVVLACRGMQGVSGGGMIALAFQSVFRFLPKTQRGAGMVALAIAGGVPPSLAPVIAGALVEQVGPRLVLVAPLLLLIPALLLILDGIPPQPPQWAKLKTFDWLSAILSMIGFGATVLALEEANRVNWSDSPALMALLAVGLACVIAFFVADWTSKAPMINLGVLREGHFAVACATQILFRMGLLGSSLLIPELLAANQGYRAFDTGHVLIWSGLPQLVIVFLVLELAHVLDVRLLIVAGLLMLATGSVLAALSSSAASGEDFVLALVFAAAAQSLFNLGTYINGPSRIQPFDGPSSGGLFNLSRSLGQVIGGAWIGRLVIVRTHLHAAVIVEGAAQKATRGSEAASAGSSLLALVQREAHTLAVNDALLVSAALMAFAATLVIFSPRFDPRDVGWTPWVLKRGRATGQTA